VRRQEAVAKLEAPRNTRRLLRRYAAVARNDKGPGRGTRGRESAVREGIEAIGIRLRPRDVGA